MFTDIIRVSMESAGRVYGSGTRTTVTASSRLAIEEEIPGGSTDLAIPCPIDVSSLESVMFLADRQMTIETNSGSAPDDTIVLPAGIPIIWHDAIGGIFPLFLTEDVTTIHVTLAAGSDATLRVFALQDATP